MTNRQQQRKQEMHKGLPVFDQGAVSLPETNDPLTYQFDVGPAFEKRLGELSAALCMAESRLGAAHGLIQKHVETIADLKARLAELMPETPSADVSDNGVAG